MSAFLRVVPDTNVFIAAAKSPNPRSPNKALLARWQQGCFDLLYSDDVPIAYFHLCYYPEDPDDTAFLLCLVNGDATHLVTHDQHLLRLAHLYPFMICRTVDFLFELQ